MTQHRFSYVNTLVTLSQYTKAQSVIQDYLHHKPHDFNALYLSGMVELGIGNYRAAQILLRQAVDISPNQYYACYNLGAVLSPRPSLHLLLPFGLSPKPRAGRRRSSGARRAALLPSIRHGGPTTGAGRAGL